MSTRAAFSGIIPKDVETVWSKLRDFGGHAELISSIQTCEMEDGAAGTQVGAVRKLTWEDGQWRKQRLLEVSDINRSIVWELVEAPEEAPAETTAAITTVKITRVAEDNSTFITWESQFSSDVPKDLVVFEQKAYKQNIDDIKAFFA